MSGSPKAPVRSRVHWILAIVALSLCVRAGTAHFVGAHLSDAGWFQYGSYQIFDERAQKIIDGSEPAFFLTDPSRTDLIQYPPALPVAVAAIYWLSGERSAYIVQRVQSAVDAVITPLLVLGIGVGAFGWRAGYAAGVMAALSPLLAFYGVSPSADAVTMWIVLAGVWLLLLALKRASWRTCFLAGIIFGLACWFRVNPLFVAAACAAAMMFAMTAPFRKRIALCGALLFGTALIVAPIVVRNIAVFREPVLTGLSFGVNLWEGLGETDLGRENGFLYGDDRMLEVERAELGRPDDLSIRPFWPDGIARDRQRAQQALALIAQHPLWYGGVMLERMYWMLKIAGEPGPYYGTSGINCTPAKCLSEDLSNTPIAAGIIVLGGGQSVYRYLAMLLAVVGIGFGVLHRRLETVPLLSVVLYYLVLSSVGHTELRYVLPMHALLVVFAGFGFERLIDLLPRFQRSADPK